MSLQIFITSPDSFKMIYLHATCYPILLYSSQLMKQEYMDREVQKMSISSVSLVSHILLPAGWRSGYEGEEED